MMLDSEFGELEWELITLRCVELAGSFRAFLAVPARKRSSM